MKIEKISDTQIRCTLNRQDLAERELKISELAYGSDKAKALFRELMLQASYECGFEADDIPLMIEAIPISSDSLVPLQEIHGCFVLWQRKQYLLMVPVLKFFRTPIVEKDAIQTLAVL